MSLKTALSFSVAVGLGVVAAAGCAGQDEDTQDGAGALSARSTVSGQDDISFGFAEPEAMGMDRQPLVDLAKWLRDSPLNIYSFVVSRYGKVILELYAGGADRDAMFLQMSITKSFTSALFGIAFAKNLLRDPNESIAEALPPSVFPTPSDRERFEAVTIKQLLGMTVLNTPGKLGHFDTQEDEDTYDAYWTADNRLGYVLGLPIVPQPGTTFVYNVEGPVIATGILACAAHEPVFDFADKNLFRPLEFSNYEWMNEDEVGVDNGGNGIRLRALDMQKFGILFLNGGSWNGRQIIPKSWAEQSFTPWIKSVPEALNPDYGWYWWDIHYDNLSLLAHQAQGQKGQRIVVFPDSGLVVTITADLNEDQEAQMRTKLVDDFVLPSLRSGKQGPLKVDPALKAELASVTADLKKKPVQPGFEEAYLPTHTMRAKRVPGLTICK
jgi:CubicO group peptidase (beta-lactamase class C family)